MDRRRVARVSGMLYGKSILSFENVGWVLWVLIGFPLPWIASDYKFYSSFDNEMMHKYFVYSFALFSIHVLLYSSSVFTSKKKASYAELYFSMYVVVLAEQ